MADEAITFAVLDSGKQVSPLAELLRLAGPTIGTSISFTLMQFVDGWMVSRLDAANPGHAFNLAATFNGGILAFVPIAFLSGMANCVNTLASQSLGRENHEDAGAFAWQGLWVAFFSIGMLWPLGWAGRGIFDLFHHGPLLFNGETLFYHYMMAAGPIIVAASMLGNFFLGVHRPMVQLVAGVAGNVVNLVLDALLIFGKAGCPKLGLQGAAIATCAGSLMAFLILQATFLLAPYRGKFGSAHWRFDGNKLWKLLRIGIPSGVQFGSDVLCWTVFTLWLVDQFGTVDAEAQSAVMRYVTLSFMPAVGLGVAASALVGRRIGEKKHDQANAAAFLAMRVCMVYMGVCGLAFLFFRRPLGHVFLRDAASLRIAEQLFVCAAVFQVFDALNVVFISSLRGAGDTFWPTLMMTAMAWSICIFGGWIVSVRFPGLRALGPWIMATVYICIVGLYNAWRWRSGKWRHLDVLGERVGL